MTRRIYAFSARGFTRDDAYLVIFVSLLTATLFGGLHCLAWSFSFPTHQEQLAWRIASIGATVLPLLVSFFFVIDSIAKIPDCLGALASRLGLIASLLYLVFRLALLILPFMALRSLPDDAYRTVEWTQLIPHL